MKRKKIKHALYLLFIGLVTSIFVISALFIALMRSEYGQQKIKSFAIYFAEKNGIPLKIESIKGEFPLQFTLKNSEALLPNQQTVKAESISFRISFFGLLLNKLIFQSFDANEIHISLLPKELSIPQKITKELFGLTLPLKISFKKIKVHNIHFQEMLFDAHGTLDIEKKLVGFSSDLTFTKKEFAGAFMKFEAQADKKLNLVNLNIKIESDTLAFFKPWIDSDKKIKSNLWIISISSWQNFENLIVKNTIEEDVLSRGKIVGYIYPEEFEKLNLTNLGFGGGFELLGDLSVKINNLYLTNNFIDAKGEVRLLENFGLDKISLAFKTTDLSMFNTGIKTDLQGIFEGTFLGSENGMSITYKANNLAIGKYPISTCEGNVFSKLTEGNLSGHISANIVTLGEAISLFSNYSYKYGSFLDLKQISIHAPSFDLTSDLQITEDLFLLGFTEAHFNNMNLAKEFFKTYDFNGTIGSTLHLFAKDGKQALDATVLFYDYHIDELIGEKINVEIKAEDLFNKPKFNFSTKAQNIRFNKLKIETLEFNSSNNEDNNEYQLSLSGKWRTPLEVKSAGSWNTLENKININIQTFNGTFLDHPYSLTSPANILANKDYFYLKSFEITTSDSSINGLIKLEEKNSDIRIVATHFPLDFLSFNPLEVSVNGYTSAELSLKENYDQVQGSININIDQMNLSSIADENPVNAKGYFSGEIKNEKIKAKGKIQVQEKESFAEINGTIPIEFNLRPFHFKIKKEDSLKAEFALKGRIEEVLDFINIGNQRIEGEAIGNIIISDSFSSPNLQGTFKIENGLYENYVTGTSLENINCEFSLKDYEVLIKNFSAVNSKTGKLSATGHIDLRESTEYPFNIDLSLNNVLVFQTSLVSASFTGNLNIQGNKNEAFATGDIDVTQSELIIPDKIPVKMPEIDVKFINKVLTKPEMIKEKKPPYPINLDINIRSTDNIYIRGKGVDAQMKGQVKLKGTNLDMIPDGRLELVKGTYLFAGKYFDLSESSLVFTGVPKALPLISLGAKTLQAGVLITASLKGELNAPELSFSSEPSLPLSSIISLLIFGHDLSGISAHQALEIATIVAALSEGGSLLETTKRNLGIDRLAVISKAGETEDDPDKIAVEVGKYIIRGLLVSYRQGIDDGMSNASAEIDIGWGFILQIETIREEEQTRATLKWSRNF